MRNRPATLPSVPVAAAGTASLTLEGVVKHYGRRHGDPTRAVDGVDLAFAPGTWTAIMGPSGSGKSTLLHLAAGLLKPDAGTVRLLGEDPAQLVPAALDALRRDRVGFVFQSSNLVPSLTAAQNVELPVRLAGHRPDRRLAEHALARVGLDGKARSRPHELSGGQCQRVAIARALANRPDLVFADEPTGALDSRSAGAVLDLLAEIVAGTGCLVMVTHDPAVAARADRVVFLFDGTVADEMRRPTPGEIAARMTELEGAPREEEPRSARRGSAA